MPWLIPIKHLRIWHLNLSSIKSNIMKTQNQDTKVNFEELRRLCDDNKGFYIEMLETLINSLRYGIEDLRKYIDQKNHIQISETAHKMCSPVRQLQIDKLYNLLKKIEHLGGEKIQLSKLVVLVNEAEKEFVMVRNEIENELQVVSEKQQGRS